MENKKCTIFQYRILQETKEICRKKTPTLLYLKKLLYKSQQFPIFFRTMAMRSRRRQQISTFSHYSKLWNPTWDFMGSDLIKPYENHRHHISMGISWIFVENREKK